MTSRTRSSPTDWLSRAWRCSVVAAVTMNQPSSAVQIETNGMSKKVPATPSADHAEADELAGLGRGDLGAVCGRRGSPTVRPARMRPPSSGAAGIRLKTASTTFTKASQPIAETTSDDTRPLAAPAIASEEEADAERDARGGPGGGDPQLGTGRRHRAAELRDPAEQPERDALDLHAVAPGDDRVGELVGEQGGEEEDHRHDRDDPELEVADAAGEAEREQPGDDEHRPVECRPRCRRSDRA